jgi:hypothetical protein
MQRIPRCVRRHAELDLRRGKPPKSARVSCFELQQLPRSTHAAADSRGARKAYHFPRTRAVAHKIKLNSILARRRRGVWHHPPRRATRQSSACRTSARHPRGTATSPQTPVSRRHRGARSAQYTTCEQPPAPPADTRDVMNPRRRRFVNECGSRRTHCCRQAPCPPTAPLRYCFRHLMNTSPPLFSHATPRSSAYGPKMSAPAPRSRPRAPTCRRTSCGASQPSGPPSRACASAAAAERHRVWSRNTRGRAGVVPAGGSGAGPARACGRKWIAAAAAAAASSRYTRHAMRTDRILRFSTRPSNADPRGRSETI